MRSSILLRLDDVDAAGAGDGFDGRRRHEQRRRGRRLLNERRGEEAGLQPSVGVRRDGFDRQRALVGLRSEGDTKRTFAVNVFAGIGVDGQPHGLSGLDQRQRLLRDRQLDAQRIDPHDRGDLRAASSRSRPTLTSRSATMPENGARTTVSAAALRARSTRARAACSERYDCCATFCADLVLLARGVRPACRRWSNSLCETTF